MSIFHWGSTNLHSGGTSWWHIDCDGLSDSDIQVLAKLIVDKIGYFNAVTCPESHPGSAAGRLVEALHQYEDHVLRKEGAKLLIVDDVLTTGASMEVTRAKYSPEIPRPGYVSVPEEIIGAVIFARGECPDWVWPIFQMNNA